MQSPNLPEGGISENDLKSLAASRFAVWVFGIDTARVVWANDAALDLWEAVTLLELAERDMGCDMSTSVKNRLRQYQKEFWNGAVFDESWTLYPKGIPKTVACRFRGCLMQDGEMAMLCEAQPIEDQTPEILRRSQALLYTGAMVTIYNGAGKCVYANPSALAAFSIEGMALHRRILSRSVLDALIDGLQRGTEGHHISDVQTTAGQRIHEIEARKSFDAVSGEETVLLTEIDVTEKERAKRDIEYLANHDTLTGLYNRTYLVSHAEGFIEQALLEGRKVFLFLLDLDRFKYVNDAAGHTVGDKLLTEAAAQLRGHFPEDAILGRLGGDEFCVVMKSEMSATNVSRFGRSFLKKLRKPVRIHYNELRIDASIGLSQTTRSLPPSTFDDLLVKADLALYDAKKVGGGVIRLFRTKHAKQRQRFLEVEEELNHALTFSDERIEVHFQPKVCVAKGCIVGAEALARLTPRNGSSIRPSEFIPIAETTGQISELGYLVLKSAIEGVLIDSRGGDELNLSVNVSPMQFHDPRLMTLLRSYALSGEFEPSLLELELTETALNLGDRRFQNLLHEIVEMGYSLAIDDFGTAYSNISRLNNHPVQCIKIDRSLVGAKDNENLALSVINIAKALGLRVVAEGVETKERRDWLFSHGCHEQQGFLYSKPLPLEALKQLDSSGIEALRGLPGRECSLS